MNICKSLTRDIEGMLVFEFYIKIFENMQKIFCKIKIKNT